MKRCNGCGREKPFAAFHRRGDGFQPVCRDCKRNRDGDRYREKKAEIVAHKLRHRKKVMAAHRALKAKTPCTDCGNRYHPAAMQWDHLPGKRKRGHVSRMISNCATRAAEREIKKCELVCANCHAIRSWKRQRIIRA